MATLVILYLSYLAVHQHIVLHYTSGAKKKVCACVFMCEKKILRYALA